jgi:hypothetical protein
MKFGVRYFLSSLDSSRFEPVRECELLKQLTFNTGKQCALVKLNPPVSGQDFNIGADVEAVVLANRSEGATLFPIDEYPCFVVIARLLRPGLEGGDPIASADLEVIGSGEIYRSRSAAESHLFD